MKKTIFIILALIIAVPGIAANKIMAVINESVITESEVEDYLNVIKFKASAQNPEFDESEFGYTKTDALHDLIEDKLIIQQARKQQFQIPQDLIDKRLDEFIDGFKYRQDFDESLIRQGLTIVSLRRKIQDQILMRQIISKEIENKIEIAPHEITDFYKEYRQEFIRPASVDYLGWQFSQKAKAYESFDLLMSGTDADELTSTYPDNKVSGRLFKGEARKELEPLFEAKVNEPQEPFSIGGTYYVFLVTGKNSPKTMKLTEVKDKIWDYLYQQKYDSLLEEWLEGLRKEAVIKIFDET